MAQAPEPLSALGAAPSLDAGNNLSRVQAPASAFGGDSAEAMQRAGRQFSAAGEEINNAALTQAGLDNETMANDARNEAVLKASRRLAEYKSLEGQAAVAGMSQYQTDVQAIFKEAGATLPNPNAQRMFHQVSGRYVASYTQDAVSHSVTENKRWQRQSLISTQDVATNLAVQFANDPGKVAEQIDVAADAAIHLSEMAGEDDVTATARAAAARGKVVSAAVHRLAADPATVDQAATLFQASRASIDGVTAARLAEVLKPKLDHAQTNSDFMVVTHQAPAVVPTNVGFESLWSAVKMQESGGRQNGADGSVLVSPKGAVGIAQVMPGTGRQMAAELGVPFDENRLRTDATYNELLGKAYMDKMMRMYGDPNLALAAYNAGPGRLDGYTDANGRHVDGWLKTIGDPRKGEITMADFVARIPFDETRNYVNHINRRLAGTQPQDGSAAPAATQQRVDGPAMIRQATEMTAGDPDRQARLLSRVTTYIHQQDSAQAQQRAALVDYTNDLGVQFLDGNPNAQAVPEQQIRALLPPDKAQLLINNLNAKKAAGQIFQSVALADPETVAAMRADLGAGQGVFSNMLRGKGTLLRGDNGEVDPQDTQDAADYRTRKQVLSLLNERISDRDAAIKSDPAAYVMRQDPMVRALMPGDKAPPAAWQNYATSTLAAQARLGVPEWQRTILPVAQADAIVRTFTTQPPDKLNAQQMLASLSQRYGSQWNNVLGQLVKQKLPGEYQVLAMMDAPNQVGSAAELQQALVVEYGTKGGRQAIKEGVDQTKRRDIEAGIVTGLAPFLATVVENGAGGRTTYANVNNAIEALAFSYAQRGKSASEAVKLAVNGVINEHYDVRSSYRIPRFMEGRPVSSDNVVSAAEAIQRSLTVADLADVGGGTVPGLTPDDRRAASLAAAQGSNAKWINNERDDGLVLAAVTKGGRYEPVLRADGGRVEFKFANPPATELIDTGVGMAMGLRPALPVARSE